MTVPAGWYPDPQDPSSQRYWDGAGWTQHTVPGVPPAAPPPPQVAAYGYAPQPDVQVRSFGFAEAVRRGLGRWTNYRDRATIAEFWWFYLFAFLVTLVLYALLVGALAYFFGTADKHTVTRQRGGTTVQSVDLTPTSAGIAVLVATGIVMLVVVILLFLPQLALTVRRLHDTDRSGWWYLLSFVPFGGLVVLVFMLLPGTPGPNRYGPPVT